MNLQNLLTVLVIIGIWSVTMAFCLFLFFVFRGLNNWIVTRISRIAADTVHRAIRDAEDYALNQISKDKKLNMEIEFRSRLRGCLVEYKRGYQSIIEEK